MYPTFERDHFADIERYEDAVVSGERKACKWEKLAIQRQLKDLQRQGTPEFPYIYDPSRALRVINFIECFPHVKGKWGRGRRLEDKLIELSWWQKWFVAVAFGWVRMGTGLRRFSLLKLFVPRKNGKSTFAAPLGLYMQTADNEFAAEVYCGATTQKQALEVFRPAKKMAELQPYFRKHYGVAVRAQCIEKLSDGSRFEALIGKPGDGSSPHLWICDEYHEHASDDFVDTMQTGQGARDQGLGLIISTAGTDNMGPCYQSQVELQDVLLGVAVDETMFGIIYTVDNQDDWNTDEALEMANPNLGISVNIDMLKARRDRAVRVPGKQNIFKIKHLNIWVTAKEAWLNSMDIKAAKCDAKEEEFFGCAAGLGLDLSESDDLTSQVVCFEKEVDGLRHYYFFGRHYATEAKANEIDLYRTWADAGALTICDGNMIDYELVAEDAELLSEQFVIGSLYHDPAGAAVLAQQLGNKLGFEVVKFNQNFTNFSPIMKDFSSLLKARRIHHDGNPCFVWMLGNVVAKETADGKYIRPVKGSRAAKIDGAVAGIMAFAAVYVPDEDDGSDQGMVDVND